MQVFPEDDPAESDRSGDIALRSALEVILPDRGVGKTRVTSLRIFRQLLRVQSVIDLYLLIALTPIVHLSGGNLSGGKLGTIGFARQAASVT